MTKDQFLEGIEPLESRANREYGSVERKMLFGTYRWMTGAKWTRLCGLVLANMDTRLPSLTQIQKTYGAHRDEFRRVKRIHVRCETCGGDGFLTCVRELERGYGTAVARCGCENGDNWPTYPEASEVAAQGCFVRWVARHEIPSVAVEKVERAAGLRRGGESL